MMVREPRRKGEPMKKVVVGIIFSLLTTRGAGDVTAQALAGSTDAETAVSSSPSVRVGLFDSRFVALAYYRSEHGMKAARALREELERARSSRDTKRVRALEAKGPALQNLMHQQVFGNLSIPNVMAMLQTHLPQIAEDAGLSLIVSKWEVQYVVGDFELVDITLRLVELFDVDEATREMIEEGLEADREPVPIDQLLDHRD
jgi:hypothetical protein